MNPNVITWTDYVKEEAYNYATIAGVSTLVGSGLLLFHLTVVHGFFYIPLLFFGIVGLIIAIIASYLKYKKCTSIQHTRMRNFLLKVKELEVNRDKRS